MGAVYIKIIGTRSDHRKCGLGKLLFKKMEKWHRENTPYLDIFEVHTWRENPGAIRFYKSLGYSVARTPSSNSGEYEGCELENGKILKKQPKVLLQKNYYRRRLLTSMPSPVRCYRK